jgi:hypothetical protein
MSSTVNPAHVYQAQVTAKTPKEGPKACPLVYDFTAASSYRTDFTQFFQNTQMSQVVTIFIDNLVNTSTTSISFDSTFEKIVAPAQSQGYYTVLTTQLAKATIASAGAFVVTIIYVNVFVAPCVWYSNGVPEAAVTIAGPLPLPVSISSPVVVPVSFTQPITVTVVNTAATNVVATQIALTTSYQNLNTAGNAANPNFVQFPDEGMTLQADPANTGTVLVSDGPTGQTGQNLLAGQILSFDFTNCALFDVKGSAAGQLLNIIQQQA